MKHIKKTAIIIVGIIVLFVFYFLLTINGMGIKQRPELFDITERYIYNESCNKSEIILNYNPTELVIPPFVEYEGIDSLYFITQWSGEPDIDTTRYYSYSDYYRVYKKLNEPKYYIIDARKDTLIGPMSKEVFEKAKKNKKDSL